jgi:hypothetical protein
VCRRIGLNWMAVLELHEGDWLSFDPRTTPELNPAQEAELVFLGSLVSAGCDRGVLAHLLAGLKKPYAYRVGQIYYDWSYQCWRVLNDAGDVERNVEEWIDELYAWRELAALRRLRRVVDEAIDRLREQQSGELVPRSGAIRLKWRTPEGTGGEPPDGSTALDL